MGDQIVTDPPNQPNRFSNSFALTSSSSGSDKDRGYTIVVPANVCFGGVSMQLDLKIDQKTLAAASDISKAVEEAVSTHFQSATTSSTSSTTSTACTPSGSVQSSAGTTIIGSGTAVSVGASLGEGLGNATTTGGSGRVTGAVTGGVVSARRCIKMPTTSVSSQQSANYTALCGNESTNSAMVNGNQNMMMMDCDCSTNQIINQNNNNNNNSNNNNNNSGNVGVNNSNSGNTNMNNNNNNNNNITTTSSNLMIQKDESREQVNEVCSSTVDSSPLCDTASSPIQLDTPTTSILPTQSTNKNNINSVKANKNNTSHSAHSYISLTNNNNISSDNDFHLDDQRPSSSAVCDNEVHSSVEDSAEPPMASSSTMGNAINNTNPNNNNHNNVGMSYENAISGTSAAPQSSSQPQHTQSQFRSESEGSSSVFKQQSESPTTSSFDAILPSPQTSSSNVPTPSNIHTNTTNLSASTSLPTRPVMSAAKRRREKAGPPSHFCEQNDPNGKGQCRQRAILSYRYCIRHILLDPDAPYRQCQHKRKPKSKKDTNVYCTNAIRSDKDTLYCSTHMIMNGMMEPKRKKHAIHHQLGGSANTSANAAATSSILRQSPYDQNGNTQRRTSQQQQQQQQSNSGVSGNSVNWNSARNDTGIVMNQQPPNQLRPNINANNNNNINNDNSNNNNSNNIINSNSNANNNATLQPLPSIMHCGFEQSQQHSGRLSEEADSWMVDSCGTSAVLNNSSNSQNATDVCMVTSMDTYSQIEQSQTQQYQQHRQQQQQQSQPYDCMQNQVMYPQTPQPQLQTQVQLQSQPQVQPQSYSQSHSQPPHSQTPQSHHQVIHQPQSHPGLIRHPTPSPLMQTVNNASCPPSVPPPASNMSSASFDEPYSIPAHTPQVIDDSPCSSSVLSPSPIKQQQQQYPMNSSGINPQPPPPQQQQQHIMHHSYSSSNLTKQHPQLAAKLLQTPSTPSSSSAYTVSSTPLSSVPPNAPPMGSALPQQSYLQQQQQPIEITNAGAQLPMEAQLPNSAAAGIPIGAGPVPIGATAVALNRLPPPPPSQQIAVSGAPPMAVIGAPPAGQSGVPLTMGTPIGNLVGRSDYVRSNSALASCSPSSQPLTTFTQHQQQATVHVKGSASYSSALLNSGCCSSSAPSSQQSAVQSAQAPPSQTPTGPSQNAILPWSAPLLLQRPPSIGALKHYSLDDLDIDLDELTGDDLEYGDDEHIPQVRSPQPPKKKVIRLKQKRQRMKMIGTYRKIASVDQMCKALEDADFDRTDLFPLGLEPSDDESSESDCDIMQKWPTPMERRSENGICSGGALEVYLLKKQLRLDRHTLLRQAQLNAPVMMASKKYPNCTGTALADRVSRCTSAQQSILPRCKHVLTNGCGEAVQCTEICLPLSNHCPQHVLYNINQKLFSYCSESCCGQPVSCVDSPLTSGLCLYHYELSQKEMANGTVSKNDDSMDCDCQSAAASASHASNMPQSSSSRSNSGGVHQMGYIPQQPSQSADPSMPSPMVAPPPPYTPLQRGGDSNAVNNHSMNGAYGQGAVNSNDMAGTTNLMNIQRPTHETATANQITDFTETEGVETDVSLASVAKELGFDGRELSDMLAGLPADEPDADDILHEHFTQGLKEDEVVPNNDIDDLGHSWADVEQFLLSEGYPVDLTPPPFNTGICSPNGLNIPQNHLFSNPSSNILAPSSVQSTVTTSSPYLMAPSPNATSSDSLVTLQPLQPVQQMNPTQHQQQQYHPQQQHQQQQQIQLQSRQHSIPTAENLLPYRNL